MTISLSKLSRSARTCVLGAQPKKQVADIGRQPDRRGVDQDAEEFRPFRGPPVGGEISVLHRTDPLRRRMRLQAGTGSSTIGQRVDDQPSMRDEGVGMSVANVRGSASPAPASSRSSAAVISAAMTRRDRASNRSIALASAAIASSRCAVSDDRRPACLFRGADGRKKLSELCRRALRGLELLHQLFELGDRNAQRLDPAIEFRMPFALRDRVLARRQRRRHARNSAIEGTSGS